MNGALIDCLTVAARRYPEHTALSDRDGALTFRELEELSARMRDRLRRMSVRRGARVGIYMRNSADACAAMLGVLRAGATYVPIPGAAPAAHAALITHANGLDLVVAERNLVPAWREQMANYGRAPDILAIGTPGGGLALWVALHLLGETDPAPETGDEHLMHDDLAFTA